MYVTTASVCMGGRSLLEILSMTTGNVEIYFRNVEINQISENLIISNDSLAKP